MFRERPERPALQPLLPVQEIPFAKLLQPRIVAPRADGPFVGRLHDVGEPGTGDVVLHGLFHQQSLAEGFPGLGREDAALIEEIAGDDGPVVGFEDRVEFGLFDVAAGGKMAVGRISKRPAAMGKPESGVFIYS